MTIDTLKNRLSRQPFEPFRVVTSSGERYDVRHPENAWLYKSGLIVAHGGGNGRLPESYADIALLHITAVEALPTGRKGRK
jgi:hypothetical protein